ncbi:hypothetical protein FACS189459_5530 [Bacilli bacterium]|nr:hypothetical protein FACS189459_5530 [Bacilli bacterium]
MSPYLQITIYYNIYAYIIVMHVMTKIYKAILPCAGIGSRMAPITKIFPKEMLPLNCKPAIYFVIKECIDAGINDFLVIISLRKKILVDYLIDEFGDKVKLTFINQQIANGLAKAVELGKE